MLVENRQQFVLVDGDKLVEGLFAVISHKGRVIHVFHYSVQVDGLDLSVAHSMYGVSGTFSQQAQEDRVMIYCTYDQNSSVYLCFRCLGTFWQCQNLRQGAAILDFKMAAICFTLLCISLPVALWKENKDSLYLGKCLPFGNCHHMVAISEFKMATTLIDMPFSMI